jgi:hypothetical protein
MKRMISLVCALVMVPVLAAAQPSTPEQWYKEGETQYNLGNFDKAVDAFKKGFELENNESKKAAYLFNIAQSYRQAKNCKDAQFFYKRYLALKDADTVKPISPQKRQEVEDRIKELDECAKQQEAIRNKPPDANEKPDPGPPGDTKPDKRVADPTHPKDPKDPDDPDHIVTVHDAGPKVISLRVAGGGAKVTGTGTIEVPIQATVALVAGYPIPVGEQLTVEVGAGFTFTPLPYDDMAGQSKSAQLIGLMANVGGTYHAAPKIGLRGDLGLGVLILGGASESPFTNFAATSGALAMPHVRLAVSAEYAFTPNVVGVITPLAFSFSPPKAGLDDQIKSFTAFDFMVGIGYRM